MAGIAGDELMLVVSDAVLTRLAWLGQGGELAHPPLRLRRGAPRLLPSAPAQPAQKQSVQLGTHQLSFLYYRKSVK